MSQVLCRKFGGEDVRFNLVLELVEAAAKRAVASGYRAQRLGQAGTQTFSFQRWMLPFDCRENDEVRTWVMPQTRMNSLKSRAMNCGPLLEMIRDVAWGNFSRARCKMISTSASVIHARIFQCTR